MALGPGAAVVPWCVLRASSATLLAARSCMADGWLAGAVALLVATKALQSPGEIVWFTIHNAHGLRSMADVRRS
jgi:hypothetical protein